MHASRRFLLSRANTALMSLTGCVLLALTAYTAFALKIRESVTPASAAEEGFSIRATPTKDGKVDFEVVRDLSKARALPAERRNLIVVRRARLVIAGADGVLAECDVAPAEREEKGAVKYRFTLARACVPYSSFTVAEDDDYKGGQAEHLIGGGTRYEIQLADFAEPVAAH